MAPFLANLALIIMAGSLNSLSLKISILFGLFSTTGVL